MVELTNKLEGDIYFVFVNGEVDASSSIILDEEMGKAVDQHSKIIVNLTDLEYISSAGLGVFMSYIQDLEAKNAQMILCDLKEKVYQVFQILGLDQVLQIVDTEKEAIEKLNDLPA
jgi:anti-sigma B factor antagonist